MNRRALLAAAPAAFAVGFGVTATVRPDTGAAAPILAALPLLHPGDADLLADCRGWHGARAGDLAFRRAHVRTVADEDRHEATLDGFIGAMCEAENRIVERTAQSWEGVVAKLGILDGMGEDVADLGGRVALSVCRDLSPLLDASRP